MGWYDLGAFDRLHVFLGLTAMPDYERTFERLCANYQRKQLPPDARYGGTLWLASGRKPG